MTKRMEAEIRPLLIEEASRDELLNLVLRYALVGEDNPDGSLPRCVDPDTGESLTLPATSAAVAERLGLDADEMGTAYEIAMRRILAESGIETDG